MTSCPIRCMCRARLFALATQISIPRSRKTCPSRFAIYDNGKLGFVDIEQKAAGLVPLYTDLKNPNFGEVAKAMGLWGRQVSKADELEESVQTWLAQPGAAVLHVKVKAMQLVTPWWARARTWPSPSAPASSTPRTAAGSTPTPSTTR